MANQAKMLKNPRNPESFSGSHNGCSCCNPKRVRAAGTQAAKRREEREFRRDLHRGEHS